MTSIDVGKWLHNQQIDQRGNEKFIQDFNVHMCFDYKIMITIILFLKDMQLHIMKDLGNLSSEFIFRIN